MPRGTTPRRWHKLAMAGGSLVMVAAVTGAVPVTHAVAGTGTAATATNAAVGSARQATVPVVVAGRAPCATFELPGTAASTWPGKPTQVRSWDGPDKSWASTHRFVC